MVSAYELSQCEEIEDVPESENIFGILNCTAVRIVLSDTTLISVQAKEQGRETIQHHLNFSNWFSFYQRQDGVVRFVSSLMASNCIIIDICVYSKVRYPVRENIQVLQLKKAVASSFSLKLHNYVRKKGTSKQYGGWTYRVPDVDHTGTHSAR